MLPELVAPPEDFVQRAKSVAAAAPRCPASRRASCARWSPTRWSTCPAPPTCTPPPAARGSSAPASARTWRTWSSAGSARSASRLATSPATTTPPPTRWSARPWLGASHAWVEWWDDGWHPFDLTAAVEPDDRYVVVATGRDYDDVKPISGIYSGAGTSEMTSRSRSPGWPPGRVGRPPRSVPDDTRPHAHGWRCPSDRPHRDPYPVGADGLAGRPRRRASTRRRGRSGLHRARWWVTPTRGDPRDSATENRPPALYGGQVRVKRWCKRPPAARATGSARQTPLGARSRSPLPSGSGRAYVRGRPARVRG